MSLKLKDGGKKFKLDHFTALSLLEKVQCELTGTFHRQELGAVLFHCLISQTTKAQPCKRAGVATV